ncbi:hypothetical protein [Hyphococcus sp.]|uniref:hypothetical protein n=1 Tax=Hyphococcus sp. TaxID=2038636 RepID=UPI003752272E
MTANLIAVGTLNSTPAKFAVSLVVPRLTIVMAGQSSKKITKIASRRKEESSSGRDITEAAKPPKNTSMANAHATRRKRDDFSSLCRDCTALCMLLYAIGHTIYNECLRCLNNFAPAFCRARNVQIYLF